MALLVRNLRFALDVPQEQVLAAARRQAGVPAGCTARIHQIGVDARHKRVSLVYTVFLDTDRPAPEGNQAVVSFEQRLPIFVLGREQPNGRIIVGGFGPAGMFCALMLARQGYQPLVLERGSALARRVKAVSAFWKTGLLNDQCNVQFGEGGAGTFSDGKLTTRINSPHCACVLQELVAHGAPEDILTKSHPHIGTDCLGNVVQSIREEILALGGEVRFDTRIRDLTIRDGKLTGVTTSDGQSIQTAALILAPGHSARDTYEMLHTHGVAMEQKAFSVGVRAEHPQRWLDQAMYGTFAGHPMLGPAEYQVAFRFGERGVYSFCMCPGGQVVNASSEQGALVVNGMSNHARSGQNANAAIAVSVLPSDFGSDDPLAGIALQRRLERAAFLAGGGRFAVPVQRLGDYLAGRPSSAFGTVTPDCTGETHFADLRGVLPGFVNELLERGFRAFDRQIQGFANPDTILSGVESRTSAPLRLLRGADYQSIHLSGLYPCGEGAGYAGGIMSAAVDGVTVAQAVCARFASGGKGE